MNDHVLGHPLLQGVKFRLIIRSQWTPELVDAACKGLFEYMQLLTYSSKPLVPPYLIDEAWHEALIDTRRYPDFCEVAVGQYVHHEPPIAPPDTNRLSEEVFVEEVTKTIILAKTRFANLDERVWNEKVAPWQKQLRVRSFASV